MAKLDGTSAATKPVTVPLSSGTRLPRTATLTRSSIHGALAIPLALARQVLPQVSDPPGVSYRRETSGQLLGASGRHEDRDLAGPAGARDVEDRSARGRRLQLRRVGHGVLVPVPYEVPLPQDAARGQLAQHLPG